MPEFSAFLHPYDGQTANIFKRLPTLLKKKGLEI